MKLLLSGGGTGGHLYPALSTAEALRASATDVLFLGSLGGPEGDWVRRAGWKFEGIPAAPVRRDPRSLAKAAFSAALGLRRALVITARFSPDVVIATGGYAAVSAGLAAGMLGIPLVLQEPNAVPGRVTRLLAPMAALIATALPGAERRLPRGRTIRTGFPIRADLLTGSAERARDRWNLDAARPTLLVYGGSQGARTLNLAVASGLHQWREFNVLHSTGKKLYNESISATSGHDTDGYRPLPYIESMADAYAVADLVVCRGGASSIAEATACGVPVIVVPYPHHADRHQEVNGCEVERAGAGRMVLDSNARAQIPDLVNQVLFDPAVRARWATASRQLGRPDAASAIAKHVVNLVGRRS